MKSYKTYIDEEETEVSIEKSTASINGFNIELISRDRLGDTLRLNGEEILVDDIFRIEDTDIYRVEISGFTIDVKVVDPINEALAGAGASNGNITSPMAGTISNINVKNGDEVKEGQVLLVISAMKMENQINSPVGGIVRDIKVNINEQVPSGKLLVTVEPKE